MPLERSVETVVLDDPRSVNGIIDLHALCLLVLFWELFTHKLFWRNEYLIEDTAGLSSTRRFQFLLNAIHLNNSEQNNEQRFSG